MQLRIRPNVLGGEVAAIPSKSDAHRLLIAAALADAPTRIALNSGSRDIDATVGCLRALGTGIRAQNGVLTIAPPRRPAAAPTLDCAQSGTTLRLLLPVAAALCEKALITGQGRLPDRPIAELLHCLHARGAVFDSGRLPLTVLRGLTAGEFTLPGDISSQYVSGLLFALPLLDGASSIRLTTPLESAGYVDMTLSALARFGISAGRTADGFFVPGGQIYRSPGEAEVEGDWSNAAFFLATGALSRGVTVTGLNPDSAQPDRALPRLLERFGALALCDGGSVRVCPAPLTGADIDVSQSPDLVPILAVLGACARGRTRLYNARRLRMKESDRLASVCAMLRALGVQAEELPDALVITGSTPAGTAPTGGSVDCAGDHRIAMAASILAAARGGATLLGAECVEKSYPSFFEDYRLLGGIADVVDVR